MLDGDTIDPRSGPDDRPAHTRPEPTLDPHAVFDAQGLYRTGHHGDLPSIPWYTLLGNHDVHSIGVFPIYELSDGHRAAPLPLIGRLGLVLPVWLDPLASFAYGNVTPAEPGPPVLFATPRAVAANPDRAFISPAEFVQAMFETVTQPAGHGFAAAADNATWYSLSPVAGVRLIALDTTDANFTLAGGVYSEGALSDTQMEFLRTELDAALEQREIVIVATHHPSAALMSSAGSDVTPAEFRSVLSAYPNVLVHLAGHHHHSRVTERDGYLEIETCSTLDLPQEGRLIEIWRDETDGRIVVTYEMFSHIDDTLPALGADPLRALREQAQRIALADKNARARQRQFDPSGSDPYGRPEDRAGAVSITPR